MNTDTPILDEARALVGFCEHEQEWYKFIDEPGNLDSRRHPECGNLPSARIGFQITTQRSFNPSAKKLSKAQLKKMNSASA